MGSIISVPGIECLMEARSKTIDLRNFIRDQRQDGKESVFLVEVSRICYLFIFYNNEYWLLNGVVSYEIIFGSEDYEISVDSQRKYLVPKDLKYNGLPYIYKDIKKYIS